MSGGRREGQRGTQGAYAAIQTRRHLDLFIRVRLPAVRGEGVERPGLQGGLPAGLSAVLQSSG